MRAFVVNTIFFSYAYLSFHMHNYFKCRIIGHKIDDNAWVIETIDNCAMYVIEGKEKRC